VLKRRPDFVAKVYQPEGSTQEIHIIEQTLLTDFKASLATSKFARHKSVQISETLLLFKKKYGNDPNVKITYHIIAPKDLSEDTRKFLEDELGALEMPNAKFVWITILPRPK